MRRPLRRDPREPGQRFRQALERGGNVHYSIRFFTGAQHDLHGTLDGFVKLGALTPGNTNIVGSWMNGLAAGLPPGTAQPAPHQQRQTSALVPEPGTSRPELNSPLSFC